MSEPQNKVADLIKSQGVAFRTFRKTQEAMVEDVAKRVDKLEALAAGLRIAVAGLPVEAKAPHQLV